MPAARFYTLKQLIEETRPYRVSRSRLYAQYLTSDARKRNRVAYANDGSMRIPRLFAERIIERVRAEYEKAPNNESHLTKNLGAFRPCIRPGCSKKSNRKDGVCRGCAKLR